MLNEKTFGQAWKVLLQSCFNKRKKNQVLSRTSNYCVSQKRAQIESLVIYRKNNSKKHNNISVEEILSLSFWDSGLSENAIFWLGDDTNSNIIPYVSLRIKNKTWSFQRETDPVQDILSVYALPCFLVRTSKRSYQRKQTKSGSKF